MHRLLKEYKGKLRLVIKTYPYKYRDFAHIAAEAAHSAWAQGKDKFDAMHRIMLEKSPLLDRDSLISHAREAGLDLKKFIASLDAMKHNDVIKRDLKLALNLDLYNTPTFFINGRRIVGNVPYAYLKKVIDDELKALDK